MTSLATRFASKDVRNLPEQIFNISQATQNLRQIILSPVSPYTFEHLVSTVFVTVITVVFGVTGLLRPRSTFKITGSIALQVAVASTMSFILRMGLTAVYPPSDEVNFEREDKRLSLNNYVERIALFTHSISLSIVWSWNSWPTIVYFIVEFTVCIGYYSNKAQYFDMLVVVLSYTVAVWTQRHLLRICIRNSLTECTVVWC